MEGMFAAFFVNHQIEPTLAQAVAARLVEEGAYATGPALSSQFADEPSPWCGTSPLHIGHLCFKHHRSRLLTPARPSRP